ncbi:MAG: hypothetical protein IKX36_08820 [Prevotella sp.]|nr:hypothetical protein [Prevotella sp.]
MKRLTERFFEGETTLEEEQTLYAYYNGTDISAELKEYAEVFRDFAALSFDKETTPSFDKTEEAPKAIIGTKSKRLFLRIAVAASVTLLAAIGTFHLLSSTSSDEECVAYIYGKKYTDPALVNQEMRRTMSEFSDIDEENGVESQLRDMFITE